MSMYVLDQSNQELNCQWVFLVIFILYMYMYMYQFGIHDIHGPLNKKNKRKDYTV